MFLNYIDKKASARLDMRSNYAEAFYFFLTVILNYLNNKNHYQRFENQSWNFA